MLCCCFMERTSFDIMHFKTPQLVYTHCRGSFHVKQSPTTLTIYKARFQAVTIYRAFPDPESSLQTTHINRNIKHGFHVKPYIKRELTNETSPKVSQPIVTEGRRGRRGGRKKSKSIVTKITNCESFQKVTTETK